MGKLAGARMGTTLSTGCAALAAAVLLAAAPPAAATPSPGSTHFPRYKELEPNVAFWGDVFTKWTSHQIAFHDVEHLDLIYSVLSLDDIFERLPEAQQDDAIQARRKAEGERIAAMLLRIADGHARTEEERRILKSIARVGQEPSYASTLSEQVRSQRGLGDKFCEAAARAESYRPMMSEILRSYDVPEELLALPLVESGYKIGARSSAGASGIWQFMPSTGRLYLEVNSSYDDRRDPRRSTEAAARMLRKTYDTMGSWPLAITSYNHGPGGIARAVKDMGTTHFGVISRHYKGKSFGFASRNYYAEFLAAADAMRRSGEICGAIAVEPYRTDEAMLGASASIRDLARAAGTTIDRLGDLNPALSETCSRGSAKVPRGYRLNLPNGSKDEFAVAFGHVDHSAPTLLASTEEQGTAAAANLPITHRVVRGETLGQIARRYGTTETTLLYMNRLRNASAMKVGQNLKVPSDRVTTPVAVAEAKIAHPPFSRSMTTTAGIVAARQAGEAASAAALAAQTAVAAVPAAVIQRDVAAAPAQHEQAAVAEPAHSAEVVASLPKKAPPAVVTEAAEPEADQAERADAAPVLTAEHKIGRGQTLTQIASMYHMPVEDLKRMNGITDGRSIQAGQTIKVRASGSEIVAGATVGRTYKVHSGDTLWTVARANDTSVETLKRLNPKIASAGLKAGDTIKVPSAGAVSVASADEATVDAPKKTASKADGKTASKVASKPAAKVASKSSAAKPAAKTASYRSHRVQKGQTLTSIAQRYKTSVDTLKRINGIRDARNVRSERP